MDVQALAQPRSYAREHDRVDEQSVRLSALASAGLVARPQEIAPQQPTFVVDTRSADSVEQALRDLVRALAAYPERAAVMVVPFNHAESGASRLDSERSAQAAAASRIVVDRRAHEVWVDGRAVRLTAKEFALLAYLSERRGVVVTRTLLIAEIWGERYLGGARTVDVHVRRLRRKLGKALAIDTIRGVGYKLCRDRPQYAVG